MRRAPFRVHIGARQLPDEIAALRPLTHCADEMQRLRRSRDERLDDIATARKRDQLRASPSSDDAPRERSDAIAATLSRHASPG